MNGSGIDGEDAVRIGDEVTCGDVGTTATATLTSSSRLSLSLIVFFDGSIRGGERRDPDKLQTKTPELENTEIN